MCDRITEDVDNLRACLSSLGENQIDENAVRELLESFGPNHALSSVNMIMDTILSSDTSCNEPKRIKAIEMSENLSHEGNTKVNGSEVCNGNVSKACTELSKARVKVADVTLDSDDDDNSYVFSNLTEITIYDDIPPSSDSMKIDRNTLPTFDTITDVTELLEENNNDPNNNLHSTQILQDDENDVIIVNEEIFLNNQKTECTTNSESPKPGCSKDFDGIDYFDLEHQIRNETSQICNLLPRLKYSLIYKTLLRNKDARNRIELTLWDLLPKKKPIPQPILKRKSMHDDMCTVLQKKNPNKSFDPNKTAAPNTEKLLTQKNFSSHHWENQEELKYGNVMMSQKQNSGRKNRSENKTISNGSRDKILRPPKLIIGNPTNLVQNTLTPTSVLVPPKLIYPREYKKKQPYAQHTSQVINVEDRNSTVNTVEAEDIGADCNISHFSNIVRPLNGGPRLYHAQYDSNKLMPATSKFLNSSMITSPSTSILRPPKLLYDSERRKVQAELHSDICIINGDEQSTGNNFMKIEKIETNYKAMLNTSNARKPLINNESSKHERRNGCNVGTIKKGCTLQKKKNVQTTGNNSGGEYRAMTYAFDDQTVSPMKCKQDNMNFFHFYGSAIKEPHSTEFKMWPKKNTPFQEDTGAFAAAVNCTNAQLEMVGKFVKGAENQKTNFIKTIKSNSINSNVASSDFEIEYDQTDVSNYDKDVYYRLTCMFPGVDIEYLKLLCSTNDTKHCDKDTLLTDITDHLLSYGKEHPRMSKTPSNISNNRSQEALEINEQYTDLLGIFPDADPIYLRDIATKLYNKPDEMKDFVQCKLEDHDYPTKEQYLMKRRITEQQKQYTTEFNVQNFLKIIPDPVNHFENPNRVCTFNAVAFEFLKHHFEMLKVNTLMSIYTDHKYNLTLTTMRLESMSGERKCKRITLSLPTEDIPLLQEIAFLRHKFEIIEYIANLKDKEAKEFKMLKERQELLTCECCYDTECMPTKCSPCNGGHVFCNYCIIRGTETKLADGETHVECFLNCGQEFDLQVLKHVLPPTKFSVLLQKRQEAEVMAAGLEGLVSCPFCHFASIPPPEDKVFKCYNPDCMKETCRLCKALNHIPLKCHEIDSEKAQHYLEEQMTQAFVRVCYKCGKPFFKEEGCNKMSCVCGAQMCYVCNKPVTDYRHFTESRIQGKCPLWINSRQLNADRVLRVAQATKNEIARNNPNIKLKANALL